MLQPPENKNAAPSASNTYTPVKTSSAPMEQATIGRSLVIKGDISGAESLFVDGRIEGTVNIPENRVTVGRNGVVQRQHECPGSRDHGQGHGNVMCSDRLDIRSEGSVTGDVVVQRISVEDGAILKGSVQVQAAPSRKTVTTAIQAFEQQSSQVHGRIGWSLVRKRNLPPRKKGTRPRALLCCTLCMFESWEVKVLFTT